MKKLLSLLLVLSLCSAAVNGQILKKLKDKIKDKTNQRVDQKEDQAIDKTLDNADPTKKKDNSDNKSNTGDNKNETAATSNNITGSPSFKTYQNYDFVPGDNVLFEDHFADDQDGEFPAHWDLEKGQATLNKVNGVEAMSITEGNYAKVTPRMKTNSYLTDPFTVECDYLVVNGGAYGINIFFETKNAKGEDNEVHIYFGQHGSVGTGYFTREFSADYPDKAATGNDFYNKWHHAAIIYKNKQMKCYLDQYRVLVIPNIDFTPLSVKVGGIGDQEKPILFTNFRIASGGNMNMIGKKFTETKIVTHGINFDIDKATIKPESMGTLNMIVKVMTDNPDLKFEVDGHTDNTGAAAHNLTLSQQRADAVRDQLVKLGIDASRLTSKGFGDTKPISDNNTLEGRANNRRVEFVKM
ncbi:MAG: hypothetical protein B6D37_05050 [Sphingobacteriales bacterium UTBCD1]|jgi:outer membrane protein OmpA-like peptidoglycan-associated protein|nr:MAG: hypothetical protein B6D37_05050 [Sphingobacteriales bacterium UTBCD1]